MTNTTTYPAAQSTLSRPVSGNRRKALRYLNLDGADCPASPREAGVPSGVMKKLVRDGLAQEMASGFYLITEAGRAALSR